MAPNKGSVKESKVAAKAAKKEKQVTKAAKKEAAAIKATSGSAGSGAAGKGKGKGKGAAGPAADEEEDLDAILERYQAEIRANATSTVTTLEAPPPPRTGALFLPSPSTTASEPAANHLYLLFGEYFDGSRATFYNSTLRYDIAKDEWREYKSPEAPAPRSSAAGVWGPGLAEGGGIVIFGGEYASPTQTTFHHYKDMWVFSIKTHTWNRMDFKRGPSGRSGHRMVLWKQYIILFGGFIDVGIRTNYLSDLWIFDTEEFRWKQIENLPVDRSPGARSGFSFIPSPEGAILHGGYRKEYVKGTRPKGVALDDTWLLRMDTDLSKLKWERRKRSGYLPSLRSGCSMTPWANKGMGVLFGGVLDEERDEESMESVFFNDLFAYNPAGNGRWVSLNLKKRNKGGKRRVKKPAQIVHETKEDTSDDESGKEDEGMDVDSEDDGGSDGEDDRGKRGTAVPVRATPAAAEDTMAVDEPEDDADDPARSIPLTRYNAMLAIVKNTLFIYGGIYETTKPAREYTLDDFVTLNLENLDKYTHIRGTGLEELEWQCSSDEEDGSSDDEDGSRPGESDEDGDEDEEDEGVEGDEIEVDDEDEEAKAKRHAALTQAEKEALRQKATKFMGVAKDQARSEEDVQSTPLPGEVLRTFYDRTKSYWASVAWSRSGSRGKEMRREGFQLVKAKYEEYKPILEEIERIVAEAKETGAESVKRQGGGGTGEGRNRR